MKLMARIDGFFFRSIGASGFGLMRIAWAATAFVYLLAQHTDIVFFYGESGMIPHELYGNAFRAEYRFSLLDAISNVTALYGIYTLLLVALLCVIVGYKTRVSTVVATLLLFSFHERNLLPLGGGETVLRNLGFLLMISPGISAFSLDRAKAQWVSWEKTLTMLEPLRMPIWPWRLLLWQYIVIYVASAMDKVTGAMWRNGTAVASALHHEHFARWPMWVMDGISAASPVLSSATLIFEFGWLLLLIPTGATRRLPPILRTHSIRRALLLGGVLFHGAIFLLMDVGSFPLAMLAGYLGLLLEEDFEDLRTWINRHSQCTGATLAVLYDAACRLCRRSMVVLLLCDHLHRLTPVNFRDPALRKTYAPDIALADLDRSMHVRMTSAARRTQTYHGFHAFRALSWHLPVLWPVLPLLYVPGVSLIGTRVYGAIAARRNRCADGYCIHEQAHGNPR